MAWIVAKVLHPEVVHKVSQPAWAERRALIHSDGGPVLMLQTTTPNVELARLLDSVERPG